MVWNYHHNSPQQAPITNCFTLVPYNNNNNKTETDSKLIVRGNRKFDFMYNFYIISGLKLQSYEISWLYYSWQWNLQKAHPIKSGQSWDKSILLYPMCNEEKDQNILLYSVLESHKVGKEDTPTATRRNTTWTPDKIKLGQQKFHQSYGKISEPAWSVVTWSTHTTACIALNWTLLNGLYSLITVGTSTDKDCICWA